MHFASSRSTRRLAASSRSVRRTIAPLTLACGLVLGTITAAGVTASVPSASAAVLTAASGETAQTHTIAPQPVKFAEITQDSKDALSDARSTVAAAQQTVSEVNDSGLPLEVASTDIDTTALQDHIETLSSLEVTPMLFVPKLTDEANAATADVQGQIDALKGALQDAKDKKAAEEEAARIAAEQAAAQAAAEQAAAEQAAAEKAAAAAKKASSGSSAAASASAPAPAAVSYGDPRSIGRDMVYARGWGDDQWACLDALFAKESGWNPYAQNRSSGAYGIPQALPGSKMASAGADWQTNPATQIAWGLGYISARYGTPCGAWGHSQSVGWY